MNENQNQNPDMYYMEIDGQRRNFEDRQARTDITAINAALNGLSFGISQNNCLTITYDDGE